jgi:catechol 2,3-dioxygenase-like lactoylglutathione lyase family enzyme
MLMTIPTIDDAKAMARRLRDAMQLRGIAASHSDALELVAAQLGHRDWNTASASLGSKSHGGSRFVEPIPVLRSLDERKCRTFYCDFLGFDVDFEHRFGPTMPLYLGVVRGPVKIHLSEHRGDATTGSAIFVWMTGLGDYHRELATRGSTFSVPEIVDQPWGREIGMVDPFGNRLRFCEKPPSG